MSCKPGTFVLRGSTNHWPTVSSMCRWTNNEFSSCTVWVLIHSYYIIVLICTIVLLGSWTCWWTLEGKKRIKKKPLCVCGKNSTRPQRRTFVWHEGGFQENIRPLREGRHILAQVVHSRGKQTADPYRWGCQTVKGKLGVTPTPQGHLDSCGDAQALYIVGSLRLTRQPVGWGTTLLCLPRKAGWLLIGCPGQGDQYRFHPSK